MNSLWQDILRELAPPPMKKQPVAANDEEDAWEALSAQLRQNTRPAPATPPVKPQRKERYAAAPARTSPPPNDLTPNDLTNMPTPQRADNRYAAMLRGNPQNVRDAVVLAEILGAPKWR